MYSLSALGLGNVDAGHFNGVAVVFEELDRLGEGVQGHGIEDYQPVRLQPPVNRLDDLLQHAAGTADKDPVRIGQIFQHIRGIGLDQLYIAGDKLLQILPDEGDALGVMLNGKELAVGDEIARLDRYGAAPGADVPDGEIILQLQLGKGDGPHLLLGDQLLGSGEFVIVYADQRIMNQIRLPGLDQDQDVQFGGGNGRAAP